MIPESHSLSAKVLQLSPRESEVMMWTACGKTCEEISTFLFLSKETIRAQIKSACRKLNASNKTHAIAIALTHGLLTWEASPKRVIPLTTLFGLSRNQPASRTSPSAPDRRGVGNTLEDLLGIVENNLPLPNAAEWELKCQRAKTSSLTTLLHSEPSPRAMKLVPSLLLPKYGWNHKEAGKKHPMTEMSFRQTINALNRTDRGFGLKINKEEKKFEISFDRNAVSERHSDWLKSVEQRTNLNELSPQPYWGFDDLFHSVAAKLHNCFYIKTDVKKIAGKEHYHYRQIKMLRKITLERFIEAMSQGFLLVDFDARTGHNHGTKFRLKQDMLPMLYEEVSDF